MKQTNKTTKEGVVTTYWCRLSKRKGYNCRNQIRTKENGGMIRIERNNVEHMHEITGKYLFVLFSTIPYPNDKILLNFLKIVSF